MSKKIAIVGGGIAGLTAAISLQQKGFDPIVFERSLIFRPLGAGLALAANAMLAYKKLGLEETIQSQAHKITQFNICDHRGKIILKSNHDKLAAKHGVDSYAIHRATLHNILLNELDPSVIVQDKKITNLDQQKNRVHLYFEDGTTHETEYLIAADGIHSAIRQKLLPHSTPRYAGYTCWRGIVHNSNLNISHSTESWGRGKRFGIVPVENNTIYWFACLNAPQNSQELRKYTVKDLQNCFKEFHAPVAEILDNTKDSELIWSDIIDIAPISKYAFDNIVLIGDAAHATTPNMGQGACQAIEDAVILADEMASKEQIPLAFQSFEKSRLARTHKVVKDSWRLGKMAQLENNAIISIRNFMFRNMPAQLSSKQMEFLYQVDF